MRYENDKQVVMTLDAGGTHFVFSAIRGGIEIVSPIRLSAHGERLEQILETIINGFKRVRSSLSSPVAAISFAFPGPADYERGIIGDLENLPLFRGGTALGPMLEDAFGVPVFINNDGDLFTYGEAIAGLLPWVNDRLAERENARRYRNLLGATLGTGFGGGIVHGGSLFRGDNSVPGEINRMRNMIAHQFSVEESVSVRGIKHVYARESGVRPADCPTPEDIFQIGMGRQTGDQPAAVHAFKELGEAAGDALANAVSLVDGLVVIGGGLSRAHPLFLEPLVKQMNRRFQTRADDSVDRLESRVFNLENKPELSEFLTPGIREIAVPFSRRTVSWDPAKRIGVGLSRLGTSRAVAVGAYAFAVSRLDSAGLASKD